jgi:methylthioxylose transferase
MSTTAADRPSRAVRAAPWVGLAVVAILLVLAIGLPRWLDWEVWSHSTSDPSNVPPLHSKWEPKVGVGTLPALAIALLGWRFGPALAERLSWSRLLVASYVVGVAWLFALAYVDGSSGITRVLGNPYEYLETARAVGDIPAMIDEFISRIPYAAEPDNWVTHVAGHPPGALLFFVVLDRLGLGGDYAAAVVVTLIGATVPAAVLVTLRTLGAEAAARRAAPFLVLGPAAVWTAVSADAVFAAVAAWGLAALAVAATRRTTGSLVGWSVLAGLVLGSCLLLSYGLALLGFLALAVLAAARSWRPLPLAAVSATAPILAMAAAGYALWEALPVLRERYLDGLASDRPASYWWWGSLAALCLSAGPVLGAALARLAALGRQADRTVLLLTGAAVVTIGAAVASGMSKAEVERIWLPFVPWLLVATAALPGRWRRWGLALQLTCALVVQHLLYTSW